MWHMGSYRPTPVVLPGTAMAIGFRVSKNGNQAIEVRPANGHEGRDGKRGYPWRRPIEPASPLTSVALQKSPTQAV